MLLTFAALFGGVVGVLPPCSPSEKSCVLGIDGALFWTRYESSPNISQHTVCRRDHWEAKERCAEQCPLALRITSPPAYAMRICLYAMEIFPYQQLAHMHPAHPAFRKEVRIALAGKDGSPLDDASRAGCRAGDYDGKSGDILLYNLNSAACHFFTATRQGAAQNATALIMTNILRGNTLFPPNRYGFPMPGLGMLAPHFMAQRTANLLAELMIQDNVEFRGMIDFTCSSEFEANSGGEKLPVDAGPCPDLSLIGVCDNERHPDDRLCSRCPLVASANGTSFCLWGNELLPRRAANTLGGAAAPPPRLDAVFLRGTPGVGCSVSSLAGHAGKAIFLEGPACDPFTAARYAEKAGAAAVVFVARITDKGDAAVRGLSQFVGIPVHSVVRADIAAFAAVFGTEGVGGGAVFAAELYLADDAVAPERVVTPATPAPPSPFSTEGTLVPDTRGDFEWTTRVWVCAAALGVLAGALALLLYRQKATAAVLPPGMRRPGRSVPLSVATTVISVTLLLGVGTVTFVLTRAAGIDTTDTALAAGKEAVNETQVTLSMNLLDQSSQARQSIVREVKSELLSLFAIGEEKCGDIAMMYRYTNTTYSSWKGVEQGFLHFAETASEQGWFPQVHSANGFYVDKVFVSAEEQSGMPSIGVTNNGSMYPVKPHHRNILVFRADAPDGPSRRAGNTIVDTLALTKGKPPSFQRWVYAEKQAPLCSYSECLEAGNVPVITLVRPMFNYKDQYLGAAMVTVKTTFIPNIVGDALVGLGLLNMTLVAYEPESGLMVAERVGAHYRVADQHSVEGIYVSRMQAHRLDTSIAFHNNALAHYLKKEGYGSNHDPSLPVDFTGEFEQSEHYVHHEIRVLNLRVVDGVARDMIDLPHEVEQRGGTCGTCTRDTPDGPAMAFGSGNALHVYLNQTVDHPEVAASRLSAEGEPWRSSDPYFASTMEMPDGRECVYHKSMMVNSAHPPRCNLRDNFFRRDYSITIRYRLDKPAAENDTDSRLFSESFEGETALIIFANGMARFNVMAYGCETKPIKGGAPAGEWITLIISRDRLSKCISYVNGERLDTALMSPQYVSLPTGNPYIVGRGVHGVIQSVQTIPMLLSDAEVVHLHGSRDFRREVPQRRWLVQMSSMSKSGLHLRVVGMLPRDDVMGVVDRNTERSERHLAVLEDNLHKELRQKSNETYLVLLVITLASVLVFCISNTFLTKPFARVSVVMSEAALMKVVTVPQKSSYILELDTMYRAMEVMTANLKSYRPFLPDSLFEKLSCVPYEPERDDDLPPGSRTNTIAIAFTDIVQSTTMWENTPHSMKEALRIHNKIVRRCLERNNGYEVKTIGDAYMVAFDEAVDATLFGLEVLEGLYAAVWPQELGRYPQCAPNAAAHTGGIAVRIGICFGEVDLDYNPVTGRCDYFGPTINKAARVESCGISGSVTVSQEVMREVLEHEAAVSINFGNGRPQYETIGSPIIHEMPSVSLRGVSERCDLWVLLPSSLSGREPRIHAGIDEKMKANRVTLVDTPGNPLERPGMLELLDTKARTLTLTPAGDGPVTRRNGCIASTLVNNGDREMVLSHAKDPVARIVGAAERTEGMVISVVGVLAVVSWNGTKPCVLPTEGAFRFVRALKNTRVVTVGLCTGPIISASVGSKRQKFIASFSTGSTLTWLLARAASLRGLRALHVNITTELVRTTDYSTLQRPVDTWRLPSGAAVTVYEVQPVITHGKIDVWGWSRDYWDAFRISDYASMQRYCHGDMFLLTVAECIEKGTHIVDAVVLEFFSSSGTRAGLDGPSIASAWGDSSASLGASSEGL